MVPFEVATGASDAACELPGHGWVTAAHARAIITAPGSTWRWLGVDQVTGRALQLGTDRYRPTRAMIEQVRALDGHCRAPGCTVAARHCDIDHHLRYPDGPTATWNTGPLHRGHHRPKTAGLWQATPLHRPDPDHPHGAPLPLACPGCPGCRPGPAPDPAATLAARTNRGLAWRTLTGREYITYPKSWTEALTDHDHPDHTPPTRRALTQAEQARTRATRDRERGYDQPPPF